jgi:hypothetical protein
MKDISHDGHMILVSILKRVDDSISELERHGMLLNNILGLVLCLCNLAQ